MIVLVVHKHGICALEGKCQAPVPAHGHGIVSSEVVVQLVQVPTRHIHVFRIGSIVELPQLPGQLAGMVRLDACLAAVLKEIPQTLVDKAPDHQESVSCIDSVDNP